MHFPRQSHSHSPHYLPSVPGYHAGYVHPTLLQTENSAQQTPQSSKTLPLKPVHTSPQSPLEFPRVQFPDHIL
jgi:hypothetical protein